MAATASSVMNNNKPSNVWDSPADYSNKVFPYFESQSGPDQWIQLLFEPIRVVGISVKIQLKTSFENVKVCGKIRVFSDNRNH